MMVFQKGLEPPLILKPPFKRNLFKGFPFDVPNPWSEAGPTRCSWTPRHVQPVLLHLLVAAEDGGAAWQRLGGLEEDHGDVGAWVPWMEVNEQKPQHSSMCDVEVSQLCGFQIPLYFLIEKKYQHNWIPQDKVVWVSQNSKTIDLYCGIWNPHYSGPITWQTPKCSVFSWFTRVCWGLLWFTY